MAQTLASSLALVTCKEPLKINLANHLRQHLLEHGFSEVRTSSFVIFIQKIHPMI
jgi:CCR4-NOT transcription complex subunit 1